MFIQFIGLEKDDFLPYITTLILLFSNFIKNLYEYHYNSNGDHVNLIWDGKNFLSLQTNMLLGAPLLLYMSYYTKNTFVFSIFIVYAIFVTLSYPYLTKRDNRITTFRETAFENNQFDKYTTYPRDGVYKKITVFHVNGFAWELMYNFLDLDLHVESKVLHYQTTNPFYFYQSEKFSVNRHMNHCNERMIFRKHKSIPMVYEFLLFDGNQNMIEKCFIVQKDL